MKLDLQKHTLKIVKSVFRLIVPFAFVYSAECISDDTVSSAFGIELGSHIEGFENIVKDERKRPGYSVYSIDAPVKNDLFFNYEVAVERSNDTIFQIQAEGMLDGRENCRKKLDVIGEHIEEKYGMTPEYHDENAPLEYGFSVVDRLAGVQIVGFCAETNMTDNGYYEKDFFSDDEDITYKISISYHYVDDFNFYVIDEGGTVDGAGL